MDFDIEMVHPNRVQRAKNVCDIVKQHYEPENQSKSMSAIWRHHVYPIIPISERTFRRYLKIGGVNLESLDSQW